MDWDAPGGRIHVSPALKGTRGLDAGRRARQNGASGACTFSQETLPYDVLLSLRSPWLLPAVPCWVFRDGDLYRMYYRGSHYDTQTRRRAHREVTCYAESQKR